MKEGLKRERGRGASVGRRQEEREEGRERKSAGGEVEKERGPVYETQSRSKTTRGFLPVCVCEVENGYRKQSTKRK